jgi:hypothetical protein
LDGGCEQGGLFPQFHQQFHPGMDGFPAKVVQTVVWVCQKNGAPITIDSYSFQRCSLLK